MKLKRLEVSAFGGINPQSPLIIDFSQSKFVKAVGDNGCGKTSLINALLVACGHLSKDNKDFVNNESGKIDIDFEFEGKDRKQYRVRVTKSKFTLEYEGEALPEPITKMKELLGIPGVSPMEIKNAPVKEIVKWLAAYTNKGVEDFEKRMVKLKDAAKSYKEARATANKGYKAKKEWLIEQGYINEAGDLIEKKWLQSEERYATKVDVKKLSAELDEAGKRSDKLLSAQTKLKQQQDRAASIEQQIASLQADLDQTNRNIKMAEKVVEENRAAKSEYEAIKTRYDEAAQESVNYEKWQETKRNKAEMDEYESAAQKMDAGEKTTLEKIKEMQAEIIPDVRGVDLVLDDEHEDGKLVRREGLYKDGVNSAQMSKTEFLKTIIQILKKNKTKILILDEYETLGSDGVKIVEALNNDGCYIVVAEMRRQQKTIEIEYQ